MGDDLSFINKEFFFILGPCVIESEENIFYTANRIKEIAKKLHIPVIFKSSYDKANRLSISSYRGPGLEEGLKILREVKKKFNLPILTDVHTPQEVEKVAEVVDIIQVPALLCRQTDLVVESAKTGKTINLKKGQFMAPWDMKNILEKALSTGNDKIIITERGSCFGYNNLIVDFRSIVIMKEWGCPIVFDATHSVQLPGGKGKSSGGMVEMVPYLAKAAVACGCNGIFMEVHKRPEEALSDSATQVRLEQLEKLLKDLYLLHKFIRRHR